MFPRLDCCYDVNDLFALRPFVATGCRKFPSHFHSTFEGDGDGDECVVDVWKLLNLPVYVAAVAAVIVHLN